MRDPSELSIRAAVGDDLDDVALVWHASASRMDGAEPGSPSEAELRRRVDVELETGWQLYVALRRDRIVGILAIKPAEACLDQLFVSPGEQRQGVGSTLLEFAKQAMPTGFTLRMAASNHRAGRFYEKRGLTMLRTGVHPRSGVPVRIYGWNVR